MKLYVLCFLVDIFIPRIYNSICYNRMRACLNYLKILERVYDIVSDLIINRPTVMFTLPTNVPVEPR
jgi:hypothetical protein